MSASLYFLTIPGLKLAIVTIIVIILFKAHQDGASPAKFGGWNKHQVKGRDTMWPRKTQVINLPGFCSEGNLCLKNKMWKAWNKCQDCDHSMNYLWTFVIYMPPTYYLAWCIIRKLGLLQKRSLPVILEISISKLISFTGTHFVPTIWSGDELPVGPIVRMTAWKGKHVVVIIMWYMCRRSEKQQINIPADDFPRDNSWKYQRPKIMTLIMCLMLLAK